MNEQQNEYIFALGKRLYAAAHSVSDDQVTSDDEEGLDYVCSLLESAFGRQEALKARLEALEALITERNGQIQWWMRTANIRSEQYRALSNSVENFRQGLLHLAIGIEPPILEAFVRKVVPE